MADSLFDNRYRYDYIFPRGRSGETLRAVDTQSADRQQIAFDAWSAGTAKGWRGGAMRDRDAGSGGAAAQ